MPLLMYILLSVIVFGSMGLVAIVVINHINRVKSPQRPNPRRALLLVDLMVTDTSGRPFRLPQMSVLTYRPGYWELGSPAIGYLTFPSMILNAAEQANFARFFDKDDELLIALAMVARMEATQAPERPAPVEAPSTRSTLDRLLERDPLGGDESK